MGKTVAKPSSCMTNATRRQHLKTFLTHLWKNDVDGDGCGSGGFSVNLHNYFSNYFPSLISSTTAFCFNLIIDFSTIYRISIEIHVIGSQCKLFNCFWGFPQNWQLIFLSLSLSLSLSPYLSLSRFAVCIFFASFSSFFAFTLNFRSMLSIKHIIYVIWN